MLKLVLLLICAAYAVADYTADNADYNNNHHHYYGAIHNHYAGSEGRQQNSRSRYSGRERGGKARHHDHDHDHDHDDDHDHHNDDHEEDDKVWQFQVGDNFGAYEFVDPSDGFLKGFHLDLLNAVCRRAGKRCHYSLDAQKHCWNTAGGIELPGQGLLDSWYDGCIGYFPTPARMNSFNFTTGFTPNFKASLYYKSGTLKGDAKNLEGRKIGFVDGWAVGKKCLSRQHVAYSGTKPGQYTAVIFDTHQEMVDALSNDKVDAILTEDVFKLEGLTATEPGFFCATGGSSVMTRYGSDVINWWNKAFDEMRADGQFKILCQDSRSKYGHRGDINCME